MKRWAAMAAVAAVTAAAWWWWPTDRRRIIAAAQELAERVSVPPAEPAVARVTRAAGLSRLLAPGFQLIDPRGRAIVDGRDAAIGVAANLQPRRGLQVSVGELDLEIGADGRTARARTNVTLREPGGGTAPEAVETRPIVLDWAKGETWLLAALRLTAPDGE